MDEETQVIEQPQETETTPEQPPIEAKTAQSEAAEKNWRETRQALREQQQLIKELKSQLESRRESPKEEDPLASLAQDDVLTRSQAERLAEIKARQIVEETMKKQHNDTAEERIRQRYPDFDDVLTNQNIEYLRKNRPNLVKSVLANSDPYAQAEAAYELAKAFCPQNDESRENMKKIEENKQKPISSNAVKKSSALDNAHAYTSDRVLGKEGRDFYYKQMQESKKLPRG